MSQLMGWSPEAVVAGGKGLLVKAADMQRVVGVLIGVKAAFAASWVGEAADAAIAHTTRRITELDTFAEVTHTAGTTLIAAGEQLAPAQAALRRALAAAAAAGSAVAEDGTVSLPALPAVPAGLAGAEVVAWAGQAERAAESVAAGLAGQVAAALDAAAAADAVGAAALAQLDAPTISPPAKPVLLTVVGGEMRAFPVEAPDPPGLAQLPPPPPPAEPEPPPAPEPDDEGGFWSNVVHTTLDVAGMVPVLGEPADLANATVYAVEGDEVNAAISMAAMIPVAGTAVTGAKLGKRAADLAAKEAAQAVAERAAKETSERVAHEAAERSAEAAAARGSAELGPNATGGKRIPNSELQAGPERRGAPPVGSDGKKIELHHRGQEMESPLDEMTRSEHRGAGNFRDNHPYRGETRIDRQEGRRVREKYWSDELDSGRFEGL